MSAAKVGAFRSANAMNTEQKIMGTDNTGHDSFRDIIISPIKDPLLSLPGAGDSSVQWIQLLHALDQQGGSNISQDFKVNNQGQGNDWPLDLFNGANSPDLKGIKGNGVYEKGMKLASEPLQTLRIPEAIVAIAQTAARAKHEPEKYLPGWPLWSPSKVQLQKCGKCSREFCSTINYRRHIRVHRKSLNIDKDSSKTRELLAAYWDKLSADEVEEILSLKDVAIEDVSGPSIVRSLASLIQKPGFSCLPHVYLSAGATLLDVVQARLSRLPMSSHELFSVLDDASEKTFMCAGTALLVQKFVFEKEAGKVASETKNLIACTSFLLEQKLVKAWHADKTAESLRCQMLLVEEEEAAQKRQAELLEKKRLKKLRQKVQKAKEADEAKLPLSSDTVVDNTSGSAEAPSLRDTYDLDLDNPEAQADVKPPHFEPLGSWNTDIEPNKSLKQVEDHPDCATCKKQSGGIRWQPIASRHHVAKPKSNIPSVFDSGMAMTSKSLVSVKHNNNYRDLKLAVPANSHMIWARKEKLVNEEDLHDTDRLERERGCQPVLSDKYEVLIGSISVALEAGNGQFQDDISFKQNDSHEKVEKSSALKFWRPVSPHSNEGSVMVESEKSDTVMEYSHVVTTEAISSNEVPQAPDLIGDSERCEDSSTVLTVTDSSGLQLFSSDVARAFLAQRWKEAIASDHVVLVLASENETSGSFDCEGCTGTLIQSSASAERSILGSAENRMATGSVEQVTSGAYKPMFRTKHEKNFKVKYVPKQKNNVPEG